MKLPTKLCRHLLCGLTLVTPLIFGEIQAADNLPISEPDASKPVVKELGNGLYQIGVIELDKENARFRVPGKVVRREPPIEFLAVAKGGHRAYESLLEMDTDVVSFNLACILIGLDYEHATRPEYHFDPKLLIGDRVSVKVSWKKGDQLVSVDAYDLIKTPGMTAESQEWIYTGSTFTENGKYLALEDGSLLGVVHDPASIIELDKGLSLGAYGDGSVAGHAAPELGTLVWLTIEKLPTKSPAPK